MYRSSFTVRACLALAILSGAILGVPATASAQTVRFQRGDANNDGSVNITDPVFTLEALFLRGSTPPCQDAADANDDGRVNISDPIYTLRFLFQGGSPPPAPGLDCGDDPTPDELGCAEFSTCRPSGTSVVINEFMALNSNTIADGNRAFSDWIEIANTGGTQVNLEGYYLTDDPTDKTRWAFHTGSDGTVDLILDPGEFLVVFASGQPAADFVDRRGQLHTNFNIDGDGEYLALIRPDGQTVVSEYDFPRQRADVSFGQLDDTTVARLLVARGHAGRALVPAAAVAGDWRALDFDDNSWPEVEIGIGYERLPGGLYAGEFETDIESEMFDRGTSVYLRVPFTVDDPATLRDLTLWMRHDDGFVAYLNGVEVARENAPAAPGPDAAAGAPRSDLEAVGPFTQIALDAELDRVVAGRNVLAIHAFNESARSERFLVLPVLEARVRGPAEVFFPAPTPGEPNSEGVASRVSDTGFTVDRGFYENPFDVVITTATPGATIRYTTDGSPPTDLDGSDYVGPLRVETTTILRAAAFRDGFLPTNVDTQTYLFLRGPGGVLEQSAPPDHPPRWGGFPADYEMDPEIVQHPSYSQTIEEDLKAIPTLSVVTGRDAMFGSRGIYMNPEGRGLPWEREASVELFSADGTESFQENAGIRIHGGAGRRPEHPKHSFRLIFRKRYGAGMLRYDLFGRGDPFGSSAVREFDKLILRGGFNNTFPHWYDEQGLRSQYVRDQWARDLQLEMGHVSAHGRYVHLYLNGLYWGLYNVTERNDEDWAALYFGGTDDDYDVIKNREVVAGRGLGWTQVRGLAGSAQTLERYEELQKRLDVVNLADYIILNMYFANPDWDNNNSVWLRRNNPEGPFRFFVWDAEFAICLPPGAQPNQWAPIITMNRTTVNNSEAPTGVFQSLHRSSEEFRMVVADRIRKYLFNDGLLTPQGVTRAWMRRADQIHRAIVAESARWGDYRRDVSSSREPRSNFPLYTRDEHYLNHRKWILEEYFPVRTDIALQQFRTVRPNPFYPAVDAPELNQHGGTVSPGFRAVVTVNLGQLHYTLDGSDPRLPGGEVSGTAIAGGETRTTGILAADAPARILVPDSDALGLDWTRPDFVDDAWTAGTNGVGYDTNARYQGQIKTDIGATMLEKNSTVYIRFPFELARLEEFDFLTLRMQYDDGFVAYLNGERIAGRNDPEMLAWNSPSTRSHTARRFEEFDVSEHVSLLRPGKNVLALHGLNRSASDSDLLFIVELDARTAARQEIPIARTTRFRARAIFENQWSALTDALFFVDEGLVISELMYHPADPTSEEAAAGFDDQDDFEYLELASTGPDPIVLNGYRFTSGIRFTFEDAVLNPGERIVLVGNREAFEARYGGNAGIRIAGEYGGKLSNAGEEIALLSGDDVEIARFTFDDEWYPATDGDGPSLELANLAARGEALSDRASWRASPENLGSPGR